MYEAEGALTFTLPDGRVLDAASKWRLSPYEPVLALIEANMGLGIGPRTIVPDWVGEKPDYNWIVGGLAVARDHAAG